MAKKEKESKDAGEKNGKDEKKTAKLQQQTEQLTKEKQELFDKLQRLSADYANFQKRAPRQIADSIAYEKKAIIKSLLPSLDNFEHALTGAKNADSIETVIEGIQLVFEHILDALKAHGVEQIAATGRQFDPAIHEAMMQQCHQDKPDNIVLQEFQKGYTLNGQVIRPSKVIVNKLLAEETPPEDTGSDTE